MVFREGRRHGIRRMIATHGMAAPTFLTIEQAREAAKLGAFIEIVAGNLAGKDAQTRIDRFAEQIRGVGPASIIMSSDLGQKANALPTEGFAVFIDAMRKKGFTEQELDMMTRRNPATLLGLK
jgi:diphthamide synthase (EF-2-diphthine--ammonia ligase)